MEKSLSHRIAWKLYDTLKDIVNTKEKRQYFLTLLIPFYAWYIPTLVVLELNLVPDHIAALFLYTGFAAWGLGELAFLFKTEKGRELRHKIELQDETEHAAREVRAV